MNLEWAHAIAAIIGAAVGVVGSVFGFGWRMGRIEGRLEAKFSAQMAGTEKRIEDHIVTPFNETLKGMRQKINDVELETERHFLKKDEFDDFRKEYREDIRDLKSLISMGKGRGHPRAPA